MELIHADIAYANSLMARRDARKLIFDDLAIYFNSRINEIAAKGETACIIRWRDFDINEDFATDEEAVTELLEHIISAGYEVELCYNHPSAFNPCGMVIGWGNNAADSIALAFAATMGELCRGE